MPLWTRCGITNLPLADTDDDVEEAVGEKEERGGTLEGLVRNVASLLSDTVLGYFRSPQKLVLPTAATSLPVMSTSQWPPDTLAEDLQEAFILEDLLETAPSSPVQSSPTVTLSAVSFQTEPAVHKEFLTCFGAEQGQSTEMNIDDCSASVEEIDEVLTSTLAALYGRATPAAVKQAWEVLSDSFAGNVDKFKSDFLNPVLELLHRIQELQDTSECPTSSWPISAGSSVVIHLSKNNCRYLRDIGDFCISVVLDDISRHPDIVLCDLTFEGIAERKVDETEYTSLLTMDWAGRVRQVPNNELVFVLRQCLVASEYTVRHLRWDEIPQLDPRNLHSAKLQSQDFHPLLNHTNSVQGQPQYSHNVISSIGDSGSDLSTPGELTFHTCPNSPETQQSSATFSSCLENNSCTAVLATKTSPSLDTVCRMSTASPSSPSPSRSLSYSLLDSSGSTQTGSHDYGTWHSSSKSALAGKGSSKKVGTEPQQRHAVKVTDSSLEKDDSCVSDKLPVEHSSSSYLLRRHLNCPQTINQLDNDLLCSGVAILPGCVDEDARNAVYIFTCSSFWHERRVVSSQLAELLLYYSTLPRRKSDNSGLAIVADIRGSTPSTINTLLEALYLFQDNQPNPQSIVHLFTDKTTQSYVIKSPLYDAKANMNLKIILTFEHLQQYISRGQIPTVLDGDYSYNHESWVRFRKKLEPFLASCRAVACQLVDTLQEISACQHMPHTVAESMHMIRAHENLVKAAFQDERLVALQNDGPAIMSALKREEESFAHSEDYRFAMAEVKELHQHLQDSIHRLARLAETCMTKLHNCLQLREYEEECHKVIDWLSQDGGTVLQSHWLTADNLRAIRQQQKDFEKFYFSAMSYIEKGNDLLEEASMLSQCGNFSEATGYKDLAKSLKRQLQVFTGQLEEVRERIEGTAKCYHLMDKSYEWALEAMKYVSSMKMEHTTTAEGLDKLLRSVNIYLSEHPPIPEQSFAAILDTADRLNNERLLRQCQVAKERCQDTHQLLQVRQASLRRARHQMEVQHVLKEGGAETSNLFEGQAMLTISQDMSSDSSDLLSSHAAAKSPMDSRDVSPVWEPQDSSTPVWHSARDGAGKRMDLRPVSQQFKSPIEPLSPYSPSVSPAKSPLTSSFSAPLPTSTTSSMVLPLSPTLSTVETPVLYQPAPSVSRLYHSSPTRTSTGSVSGHSVTQPGGVHSLPAAVTAASRPHKKLLKRASTAPVPMLTSAILEEEPSAATRQTPAPEEPEAAGNAAREQRSAKSMSMTTGSSESLPSLPEEESELDMSPNQEQQEMSSTTTNAIRDWTPVPVNTHLHKSERSTPTGPMAGLRLSEAEMKSRRTVSLIMSEMIQTERDYVRALQFITDHYVPELQRDDVPQLLRGKRTVVFGNLEKIHQFHSQYFLKQLESCQNQPFLVGQYFLQHETMFYLYALYNKNKPKSDALMMEFGKTFFREKQLELGDKMDLSSYLLKPVQRMGKYALLLKQLLKECAETEPEYPELKAAEEMVKFQLRHGNDLLAMDSLRDCDVNLQEQGRLLRQEEFLVFQGRKKSMRRIFLFEDLILFSKTRRGRQGQHDIYVYKTSFKTADIGLTENYGDSGYKFEIWFRRRSVGENYVLQAPSSEVKKAWVKDISRLLWRQAIRNRESRINELATMGIGNKPCLDIKPSEDNIQDRSINVSLGNRGARTRNSIAVSSFDYLRNGNKRPHSIISVSSTSSSGSSQSSFGLLGSLNLAFDPLDSPRLNRRSFLSNESGIVTDADTSTGDLGSENRGPTPRRSSAGNTAALSSVRFYYDVMKSRVLKHKCSDQVYTDV